MKKIIILFALTFLFSCQNNTENTAKNTENTNIVTTQEENSTKNTETKDEKIVENTESKDEKAIKNENCQIEIIQKKDEESLISTDPEKITETKLYKPFETSISFETLAKCNGKQQIIVNGNDDHLLGKDIPWIHRNYNFLSLYESQHTYASAELRLPENTTLVFENSIAKIYETNYTMDEAWDLWDDENSAREKFENDYKNRKYEIRVFFENPKNPYTQYENSFNVYIPDFMRIIINKDENFDLEKAKNELNLIEKTLKMDIKWGEFIREMSEEEAIKYIEKKLENE